MDNFFRLVMDNKDNKMENRIQLGSMVTSKKTGFPGFGQIVEIALASYYKFVGKTVGREYRRWDELYPDWDKKVICTVMFREPRKSFTWEEYIDSYKYAIENGCEEKSEFELKEIYDSFPLTQLITYPVDDLELFE